MVKVKRVYDTPARDDGMRVLVDRLWPRGLSKEKARIDLWLRDAAPSNELRTWFAHDPARWSAFKRKYFAELKTKPKSIEPIRAKARGRAVTLLFGAKEERYNNAVALKEFLERRRNN